MPDPVQIIIPISNGSLHINFKLGPVSRPSSAAALVGRGGFRLANIRKYTMDAEATIASISRPSGMPVNGGMRFPIANPT